MELEFFNWTTNPDYAEMLARPIYLGNINKHRKKIEENKIIGKEKRKKVKKAKKKIKLLKFKK